MKKSYDQLGPEMQASIDAMIFVTEAHRIIHGAHYDDERDCFFSDPKLLVDYLRGLYALDSQTNPPRYFDWHSGGAILTKRALEYQAYFMDAGRDGTNLSSLLEHLTNLPYPEPPGAGESKER